MLENNTLFVGKVAIHLERVDSTNLYLAELAKSAPIEGTAVWADEQTAGRGQLGARWEAKAGENLTASFLLLPKWLAARSQFGLSQAVALAVADAVVAQGIKEEEVHIKWPNDIYVGGKKIAGILIENELRGAYISQAIVGIGINVNQAEFAPELSRATSLKKIFKKNTDITQLLASLSAFLEQRYLQLKQNGAAAIRDEYLRRLFQYKQAARYLITASQTPIDASIEGISDTGQLILMHNNMLHYFGLKEVIFL